MGNTVVIQRRVNHRRYKGQDKKKVEVLGIKSGCWTILTAGHMAALEEAKRHCDYLIALTNFDEYVYEKKGVVPIEVSERLEILRGIRHVDEAWPFIGDSEEDWVVRFKRARLKAEFPAFKKLIVFHSSEYMATRPPVDLPCFSIADIRTLHAVERTSVSEIFEKKRGTK